MGNRRRPRNQRIRPFRAHGPRPEPGPGEAWCTQIAIVTDRTVAGDVDHAMQVTHDRLIDGLGPLRRSGVSWTQHHPGEAVEVLDVVADGFEDYDDLIQMMTDPRSLLVVAWAIGVMPEGATFSTAPDGDRS